MIIGFDAKRAFQNRTGLGNYSRTLLQSLYDNYRDNKYVLFAPKRTSMFPLSEAEGFSVVTPTWQPAKLLPSVWRSMWMTKDLKRAGINLYHGLSNELPSGIQNTRISSIVSIHDVIFEKYPEYYHKSEVVIYRKKFRSACKNADIIMAMSEQTKNDIVALYGVDKNKVRVCYQSCDPIFRILVDAETKTQIRKLYGLPEQYFLYLGSIIERKDLLSICKALHQLGDKVDIPLVVVGKGKEYKKTVQQWLAENNMTDRVIFLSDTAVANSTPEYQTGAHFPAIYQNALGFIYPSVYEGFGIPILEAISGGVPVIAANASSLPEVGGDAALYFQPGNVEQLANQILRLSQDQELRVNCRMMGLLQSAQFSMANCAAKVMDVYQELA
ncbi:glycosyltransferase family 4 protein [Pseudoflavitalea sp. G-6-1-2]|uniref:glycosyltransferase family 4 protein n=1 Tax=Pseudoflavitalea sp. G-6-1-2 TaxID=2728841 RepID=UPI00146CE86F|nr:glycosyltransferase family 1 protein [Pseudoflavitalea sp. G-6-1-2]NML21367.1 glycosyltransferase family 4 protein [Pseudoflavitalea sp. G-6-1-2]